MIDIAFLLTVVAGAIAGLALIVYAIRLPHHGAAENLHGWFRLNPFNAVFQPGKLTPQGLVLRKRLMIAAGCFVACCAVGAMLGLIAKGLAQG